MNKLTTFALGLTTAPRLEQTIDRTIDSLKENGWSNIHLFAEPNSYIPDSIRQVSRRKEVYGAWKNWFFGLQELYEANVVDYYFMCQDDVVLSKNSKILFDIEWPKDCGLISLFCPDIYLGESGLNRVYDKSGLKMAQTFIISRKVVSLILNSKEVWRYKGNAQIDNRIGAFLNLVGLYPYYHTPSLAQHIGDTSTIWPDVKAVGIMRASSTYS